MTSSIKLMGTLFRQKNISVHKTIGIQLLGMIVTLVILFFRGEFDPTDPIGFAAIYGVIATIVLFILLTLRNEHVWTNSLFRLLPTTDTRLYIMNLVSTLLSFIYFLFLQSVIIGICGITDLAELRDLNIQYLGNHQLAYTMSGLLMAITSILISWAFISMVHLVGQAISTFLPQAKQGFVRLILYTVVFFLVSYLLNFVVSSVQDLAEKLFPAFFQNVSTITAPTIIKGLFVASGFTFFWIIIFSIINIYLLHHWIETKQLS